MQAETAALTASIEELEAFSYAVAHDLRVPLITIAASADALTADLRDRVCAADVALMEGIRTGAARMDELIRALLQFSTTARAEPARRPIDLTAMARSELDQLAALDPGRTVDVTVAEALTATGDPQLIGIVLHNLLGNAWKFTSRRRRARIEFGATEPLGDHKPSGERVYFVRDNGAGFHMAGRERIFRPFERLHARHEFEGSGVGLATAHRIIDRHGGRIWAKGVPNRGAVFYFTLPNGIA
jgi:light-regulated signal transduction histidine kinase (bacteriophytochrome)